MVAAVADGDEIVIRVIDNGSGPLPARQSGLGCRLVETAAPGCWSLHHGESGGAVLVVRVSA